VTRQAPCGVAAGNGVLAAIAASDALTCLRLGRHSRGQDQMEPPLSS
jgi:hypothetical protein